MKKKILAFSIKAGVILLFITGFALRGECGKTEKVLDKKTVKVVVNKGDKIKVNYIGTLEDGVVFDMSKKGKPLEFIVGSGKIIPGLDKGVIGMKLSEEKKLTITPEDAYGSRNEKLVNKFPKTRLPKELKPEKGMVLSLQDNTGKIIPVTIMDVDKENITVDLNHPLAGKVLTFNVKVIGID